MYLVYGALSPCTLVRAGERLAASFMNLKGHCTQIHSTTSELRVVDPETANGNERFRKNVLPQVTGCTGCTELCSQP